jgi:hypothetical protein
MAPLFVVLGIGRHPDLAAGIGRHPHVCEVTTMYTKM